MLEYNPFDIDGSGRKRKPAATSKGSLSIASPDTGIPEYTPPTGGANPDGMYSGTGAQQPAAQAQPSYAQYAMPGWEQSKWGDASHTTPKYTVGRILSQFPDTPEGLQQAMPQIQQAFPGAQLVGQDKINIPGVGIVDVGVGFSQGGGQGWAWQTGDGAGGAGSGQTAGGGAFGDAIRNQIMALMGQGGNPTDSPVYQGAMRAYNTQQQRGADTTRNAIAERMAASGQANSGAMDAQIGAAEQAAGENSAAFAGNLGIRALEQQREEIMQALQLGAGLMTDEQRLALTEKLGLINANLQQQSITNQNNQYTSNMGWEQAQYSDLMNRIPWTTIFGQ
jgi:hypothetical protein